MGLTPPPSPPFEQCSKTALFSHVGFPKPLKPGPPSHGLVHQGVPSHGVPSTQYQEPSTKEYLLIVYQVAFLMDCQLFWQALSKPCPVDRSKWERGELYREEHTFLGHALVKVRTWCIPHTTVWSATVPSAQVHWSWATIRSTLWRLHVVVFVTDCLLSNGSDKKPFINFVLSLFSKRLPLDGRWI